MRIVTEGLFKTVLILVTKRIHSNKKTPFFIDFRTYIGEPIKYSHSMSPEAVAILVRYFCFIMIFPYLKITIRSCF